MNEIKTQFTTREGLYKLLSHSEYSRPNRVPFNSQGSNPVRVSFVNVNDQSGNGDRLCFNVGRELYFYIYKGVRKVTRGGRGRGGGCLAPLGRPAAAVGRAGRGGAAALGLSPGLLLGHSALLPQPRRCQQAASCVLLPPSLCVWGLRGLDVAPAADLGDGQSDVAAPCGMGSRWWCENARYATPVGRFCTPPGKRAGSLVWRKGPLAVKPSYLCTPGLGGTVKRWPWPLSPGGF